MFDVYGHLLPGTEDQVTDALDTMAMAASRNEDPKGQVRRISQLVDDPESPDKVAEDAS